MHVIAAKAACFGEALKPGIQGLRRPSREKRPAMSKKMTELGFRVVSNGTDNHVFMVDLRNKGNQRRRRSGSPWTAWASP